MNNTSNNDLITERLESLKAGILAGFCVFLAFFISSLFNSLVLARYFSIFMSLELEFLNIHFFLSAGIAALSGLLFGVTYRYIIRQDQNRQLKAGGVLAFGLIRGLTQIDVAVGLNANIVPFGILALESVLCFAIAAIAIDIAIQLNWLKPFA